MQIFQFAGETETVPPWDDDDSTWTQLVFAVPQSVHYTPSQKFRAVQWKLYALQPVGRANTLQKFIATHFYFLFILSVSSHSFLL